MLGMGLAVLKQTVTLCLLISIVSVRADEYILDRTSFGNGSCCQHLQSVLPGKVYTANASLYQNSLDSYWSSQEHEIRPRCVVLPESSADVSVAVKTLTASTKPALEKCQFAVRAGGHTPWAGAANIEDGVTIDLSKLDQVLVSRNRSTVTIGPGNRWGGVYEELDPLGLAVAGGRVASVGVGGLIIGGGVSFFSPRVGFVCDTVKRFEVVLASGKIVQATRDSNTDLWLALKGGSNNFGIVTAFELEAFEQGDFWGGNIGIDISTIKQQFAAFEALTGDPQYDPYAALIQSFYWISPLQTWGASSSIEYTKPEPYPEVYENFTSLPFSFSTMRISNLTDFTSEIVPSDGIPKRQVFVTGTYRNSAEIMGRIFDIANATVRDLDHVAGLEFSLSYQPQPLVLLEKAERAGGNSLGLDTSDGPLFNFLLTVAWESDSDDELVDGKARELYAHSEEAAVELGVEQRYLYLNYAASWQDPISGYGDEIKARLRAASRKYDPTGVFQKQVPGGFKVFA